MNIKEIWEKYKETDHFDPALEKAMDEFENLTGMSTDEVVDIADKIASGNFLNVFAASSFPLTKIASAGDILANLLDNDELESAADLIANVVAKGNAKDKIGILNTYKSYADSEFGSDVEGTALAQELKKRKIWTSFNSLYQKNIANIMSGVGLVGKKYNLEPGTFWHMWQEYTHAKGSGAPSFVQMSIMIRLLKIILSRFVKVGAVVGVVAAGAYGFKKIKDLWDSPSKTPQELKDELEGKHKPATKVEESINSTDEDVEAKSKKLFDAMDKRFKTLGGP